MRTSILGLFLLVFGVGLLGAAAVPAAGQSNAQAAPAPIDVVDIEGPLDRFMIDFVIDAISTAVAEGSQAVILKIDSQGAIADVSDLLASVEQSPIPVIAWIGDAPAVAYGGALELATRAHHTVAAPSVEIGYGSPVVLGGDEPGSVEVDSPIVIDAPLDGVIDDVQAALGPLIVSMNGMPLSVAGTTQVLETTEETVGDDGEVRQKVVPEVRFREPGLVARTMRLPLLPEATFFFLVAGLTLVAFEFFAIGPGVAAGTAALPLLLAGYGLVVLPIGWGLALVLMAMWVLTADYQRGGFGILSYLASALLFIGGLFLIDTRPQLPATWWAVLLSVIGVALFYMFAMPTVARSRFTTPTIGREYLVGKLGVALDDVAADGAVGVEVDGARWNAVAHREAGIHAGDTVLVDGVQGLFLEVSSPHETRE